MSDKNEKPNDVAPVQSDDLLGVREIEHPWKKGEIRKQYEFAINRTIIVEVDERITEAEVFAMAKRCNDKEITLDITGAGYTMKLSSSNREADSPSTSQ